MSETLNKLPPRKTESLIENQDEKFRRYFFYGLVGFVCLVFGIFLIVRIISKFV
tara:strand:- start:1594 stop:1755 length:162 start_codon:yes stop_codon:yes gene_type:complete